MFSLTRNSCLYKCWLAGTNISQFRANVLSADIDRIDVPKHCDNILITVTTRSMAQSNRFSLYLCSQLMMGTVRIHQLQIGYLYDNVFRLCIERHAIHLTSNRKRSPFSDEALVCKKRRFDCADPDLIANFSSELENQSDTDFMAIMETPDNYSTRNAMVSLKAALPAIRVSSDSDTTHSFGIASVEELNEFVSQAIDDDQRRDGKVYTCSMTYIRITAEVHSSGESNIRRRKANEILSTQEQHLQTKRLRICETKEHQGDTMEIMPMETTQAMSDGLTTSTAVRSSAIILTPPSEHPNLSPAAVPNPAMSLVAPVSDHPSLSLDDELPPVLQRRSIAHIRRRPRKQKKQTRDAVTVIEIVNEFDKLDSWSSTRCLSAYQDCITKSQLYMHLEKNIMYKFPVSCRTFSHSLTMVQRPTMLMARQLMEQFERNTKTVKRTTRVLNESLDEPRAAASIDGQLNVSMQDLELLSNTNNDLLDCVTAHTTERIVSMSTPELPPNSFSLPTELIDSDSDCQTPASTATTESQLPISHDTTDRFVDELNIFDSSISTQIDNSLSNQLDWSPTGVLKKLFHLWNLDMYPINMKTICGKIPRKRAAIAFFSMLVLQSAKFQYVVLEQEEEGSAHITYIRRSDTLDDLFQQFLQK